MIDWNYKFQYYYVWVKHCTINVCEVLYIITSFRMDLEKSILFQIAGNLEIFIITSLYILWLGINSVYEALLKIRLDQANNMAAMGSTCFWLPEIKKKSWKLQVTKLLTNVPLGVLKCFYLVEEIRNQRCLLWHPIGQKCSRSFVTFMSDSISNMSTLASDWPRHFSHVFPELHMRSPGLSKMFF
jgi:hypothetical protein